MAGNISKSKGIRGYRGKPFTYDDFTPDQIEALKVKGDKGEQGIQGVQGIQGEQGVQGIQGIPGEKGSTPNVVLRYDQSTGNLYYSSDGILVDKEYVDVTSDVYRFKGSVNTEDDLPLGSYTEISKPNGKLVGEYASHFDFKEDTKEVSFSGEIDAEWSDFYLGVKIPISDAELSEGYYVVELISEGLNYCPEIAHNFTLHKIITNAMENQVYVDKPIMLHLTEKTTFKYLNWEMNGQYFVTNADFKIKGVSFRKVNYKEDFGMNPEKYPILEPGDVYNVLKNDMNYAWTGTEWDALGGSTEDDYAREEISKLKNEVADNTTEIGNLEERISESERKIYRAENGVNSLQMALDDAIEHTTEYIQNVESQLEFKADKSDIVLVYRYRGSVETFDDLANIYKEEGYVYNVRDTGINYAWNGTEWDALGGEHRDELAHHRLDIINEQKADMSFVSEFVNRVNMLDTGVNYIDNELKTKADKSDVETLSAEVISIANKVAPSPASVTLYADRWEQDEEDIRYHQEVVVANATITPNSMVNLQLSAEQITIFYEKDLAFVAENEDGVVTVYCIGQVPENDYIIQATVSEVVIDG